MKNHRKLDKIPIGVEGNGLLVVLNNVSKSRIGGFRTWVVYGDFEQFK